MSKPYTMRDLWSIYAPIDSPMCTVDKARLYATVDALETLRAASIGTRVRQARVAARLTLREVAESAGLTLRELANIERCVSPVTPGVFARLFVVLPSLEVAP